MFQQLLKFVQKKWLKQSELAESEMFELGNILSESAKQVNLNGSARLRMRENLIAALSEGKTDLAFAYKKVARQLKLVGKEDFLSGKQKHLLYNQFKASRANKPALNWATAFRSMQTAVASFLIFVLGLTLFVVSPFELRLTKASKWTFLEQVKGNVFVNRNGRILSVNNDFALLEGDLVFTQGQSFVVIRFLDDSVARLGENTSLEIKKLYARPENLVSTQVELSLVGGQIWASVYNLVDEQSKFVVETENASAKVNSKAAFEMTTGDKSTSLMVYDNVVDFSRKSSKVAQVQPVVSGFKAQIDSSDVYQLAYNDHDVLVQRNADAINDQWAQMNLIMDEKHEQVLKEENRNFISQVVAKDNLIEGTLSDFKDNTKLIFDNADVEQARVRFIDAHVGFIKAQQILNDAGLSLEKRRAALPLIFTYKSAVKEIMASFAKLKSENPKQSEQLFAQMKENVDAQRKALSLLLPDDTLYTAKSVVEEVAANFAINDSEKAHYLLAKAHERLLEVQTLIGKDDLKGAEAGFDFYLSDLDDLVAQVATFKVAEIEPKLFELIDLQTKQIKVLNSIEKQLIAKNDQILLALVSRVNSSNIQKLINVFKTYRKNAIPYEMLAELNNTIETYFTDNKLKGEYLKEMDGLMKVYPEYQKVEQQRVVNLEDVKGGVIVDFQASADITADDSKN